MTIPSDNLRLVLISLNELKQVAVLAVANQCDPQLFSMGVVKGKEQLEAFLEMAGIDHYIIPYGQPFENTFRSAAFEYGPKQIVNDLEKGFQAAVELRVKKLGGEKLTEAEDSQLRLSPRSWSVFSSSMKSDEGMERIRAWFETNKAKPAE
jgi:hypothetical protein